MEFDLCIVGAGMFGSSAASHAPSDLRVCVVGPAEPTEKKTQRDILASHYDEGRIVQIFLNMEALPLITASIDRFPLLEKSTGIPFYSPVGFLYITNNLAEISELKMEVERVGKTSVTDLSNPQDFALKFPFLHLGRDEGALFEEGGTGHISPRQFVAAQLKHAGCTVVRDVVHRVTRNQVTGEGGWVLELESGAEIRAAKVLLCCGAFSHLRPDIFPAPHAPPDFRAVQETVAMLEISKEEAKRLRQMPAMVYDRPPAHAYILPPILYPNGCWYIKIGHGKQYFTEMKTSEEFTQWYQGGGDPEIAKELTDLLLRIIPGLQFKSSTPNACVTSHVPNRVLPYIDLLEPSLGVALVGNGCSAKSSDQVGRLAVELVTRGEWGSKDVPRDMFRLPTLH